MEKTKWKELPVSDKIKLSLATGLVTSSVVLGFVSFILLLEIPTSVLGLDGLWLSTSCAVLGISAHFNNEMTKFQANVRNRLDKLDRQEQNIITEDEDEIPNN